MSTVLDRIVNLIKWPVALLSIGFLPGMGLAFFEVVERVVHEPGPLSLMGMGFGIYVLAWLLVLRRPMAGSFFSTFEHELTHALFAWLTFHRVKGLKATWSSGGEMSYEGRGNWLILLAPYFFPTLTAPIVVYLFLVQGVAPQWVDTLLGATVAYHITSTWRETHWQQTDLKQAGFIFSFFFLPTANLAFLGAVLAFAQSGAQSSYDFLVTAFQVSEALWQGVLKI